jgi:RNA polymerase sigma factor (sigma-70 family)
MLALARQEPRNDGGHPPTPGSEGPRGGPFRGAAVGDGGSRPRLSLIPGGGSGPPAANSRTPAQAGRLGLVTDLLDVDEVVRRAQRGDPAAFTELFRRHRGDVSRLVFRMLGPTADAEDVVQEVFLQVHRSLGEFRGQAKFTTWLHRVTVNVVLMVRRAARSRPVFAGEPVADQEPDNGLLPDEDAARYARIAAFRRLLDRLPEKKRTVFVLHEIEGLSPAEISEMVDAPVLTVRTRLFYARRELAEMMRDEPALAQLVEELAGAARMAQRSAETEAT